MYQETTERVQGLLHLAQQQDEKKGATPRTPSAQQPHTMQTPPTSQPQINGIVGRTTIPPTYSGYVQFEIQYFDNIQKKKIMCFFRKSSGMCLNKNNCIIYKIYTFIKCIMSMAWIANFLYQIQEFHVHSQISNVPYFNIINLLNFFLS